MGPAFSFEPDPRGVSSVDKPWGRPIEPGDRTPGGSRPAGPAYAGVVRSLADVSQHASLREGGMPSAASGSRP